MPHRTAAVPRDFEAKARRLIREKLWHRGTTYRELAHLLSERGVEITRDALVTKVSRGKFSAAFFLLCMDVLDEEPSATQLPLSNSQAMRTGITGQLS